MSLLKELEQRLESLLEGFFARQFKSGVQPIEIAKKLEREMDLNRTRSVLKTYVPNNYTVWVSDADAERLRPFEKTLVSEFQGFLVSHAKKEGYELPGRPKIEIKSSAKLSLGEIAIESSLESTAAQAQAIDGTQIIPAAVSPNACLVRIDKGREEEFALSRRTIKIGRAADNDIIIPDLNVSRHHAVVEGMAGGYVLRDLNSTNGTFINGKKVNAHSLKDGDLIVIGVTKLHFRSEAGV